MSNEYVEADGVPFHTGDVVDSAAQIVSPERPRLRVVTNDDALGFDETLEARLDGTHGRSMASRSFSVNPIGRMAASEPIHLADATAEVKSAPKKGNKAMKATSSKVVKPKADDGQWPPTRKGFLWKKSANNGRSLFFYLGQKKSSTGKPMADLKYWEHFSADVLERLYGRKSEK